VLKKKKENFFIERRNIVPPVSHFPQLARNQAAVVANEPVAVAPRNRNFRINPINPPQEVKRQQREELRVVIALFFLKNGIRLTN
jgi:hypothetical protein